MSLLDHVAAAAIRWKKPISFLSVVWAFLTMAAHSRLIDLPKIEILAGLPATIAAGVWNGLWWGWLRPELERRRLAASEVQHG